jgi:hypothetical protein
MMAMAITGARRTSKIARTIKVTPLTSATRISTRCRPKVCLLVGFLIVRRAAPRLRPRASTSVNTFPASVEGVVQDRVLGTAHNLGIPKLLSLMLPDG